MFKGILKFIVKRVLPFIAANLDLDIDTVQKHDGVYIRVRVEVLNFVLLDRLEKTSDNKPLDVWDPGKARALQKKLNDEFLKEMKKNSLTDGIIDIPEIKKQKIRS